MEPAFAPQPAQRARSPPVSRIQPPRRGSGESRREQPDHAKSTEEHGVIGVLITDGGQAFAAAGRQSDPGALQDRPASSITTKPSVIS